MLELDLAAAGCRYLRIWAKCAVESTEPIASFGGGKLPVRLTRGYMASDIAHTLTMRVSPGPKEGDLGLSLTYSQPEDSRIQPPAISSDVEGLLQLLTPSNLQLKFECSARFFQSLEGYAAIIPLPLRSDEWKHMPFDDIVGFRFRKRDGNRTVYNVIVEMLDNELHEWLTYNWEAPLSLELPGALLSAGEDIARKFVFPASTQT